MGVGAAVFETREQELVELAEQIAGIPGAIC